MFSSVCAFVSASIIGLVRYRDPKDRYKEEARTKKSIRLCEKFVKVRGYNSGSNFLKRNGDVKECQRVALVLP